MNKNRLITLMNQYQKYGVIKGGELALPPEQAINLAFDLESLGVTIMGVDGWYYVDSEIAQALEVDFNISNEILNNEQSATICSQMVREFIESNLSRRVALVSYTLDIPTDWNIFS